MDDITKNGWKRLGGVRSQSNPSTFYFVSLNALGHLGCSCPAWCHKKANLDGSKAPCKHIVSLLNETLEASGFDATLYGLTWLAKRIAERIGKVG